MDTPAVAKRPHDDGDAPDPKRVKASEDTEMEAVDQTMHAPVAGVAASGDDTGEAGEKPKKRRDGFPKNQKGKGKDKPKKPAAGRRGTRNDEALEGGAANPNADAEASGEPKAPRLPKRMCALLIGFCGSGYRGMQM